MKLGLDFDGTIASWAAAMDCWLREHAGRALDPDRHVIEQVDRDQLQAMIGAILGTALTLEMRPEDGALDVMTRLSAHHELLVVTARDDAEATFVAEWLARHGAPVDGIVSTGRALKADTCRRLAIDVLLDDTVEHLHALRESATVPVLFRSRFGNPAPQPPFVHVVEHWEAFETLCTRLADEQAGAAPAGAD